MGIGNGATQKQDTSIGMSNGGFGNSFSTQPIKVENKFDSFKALQAPSMSHGFNEPKSWESQGVNNNETWNHDDVPISTSTAKCDNEEEPVGFGRSGNGASDEEDSMQQDFQSKGPSQMDQDEVDQFQNDHLVQGFNSNNQDEDSD